MMTYIIDHDHRVILKSLDNYLAYFFIYFLMSMTSGSNGL
jgi:hypothetical protein